MQWKMVKVIGAVSERASERILFEAKAVADERHEVESTIHRWISSMPEQEI